MEIFTLAMVVIILIVLGLWVYDFRMTQLRHKEKRRQSAERFKRDTEALHKRVEEIKRSRGGNLW